MGIQHVDLNTDIDNILEIIDRDAAAVINNVLSKDDLNVIQEELEPYLKNDIEGDNEFTGFQTKRVRLSASLRFIRSRTVLAILLKAMEN